MHHKRKKPRRQVRCTMCTDGRGGNSDRMFGHRPKAQRKFRPRIDPEEAREGLGKEVE